MLNGGLKGMKVEKVEVLMNKKGLGVVPERARGVEKSDDEAIGKFPKHRRDLKNLGPRSIDAQKLPNSIRLQKPHSSEGVNPLTSEIGRSTRSTPARQTAQKTIRGEVDPREEKAASIAAKKSRKWTLLERGGRNVQPRS
jgi:hypothetical protein